MACPKELIKAAQKGNICVLTDEVANIRDPGRLRSTSGDSLLHIAVRYNQVEFMKVLLCEFRVDVEAQNLDGKRPLHEAAQTGNIECLNHLLSLKNISVDPLKRADWTPLMLACTKSNLEVIKTLIKVGADINLQNKDGWTPFHLACREGHEQIIKFLLDCDSDIWRTKSKNGRTPLHTAALHGMLEAVDILLSVGCDVCQTDRCGSTALTEAVRGDHLHIATQLLSLNKECLSKVDRLGHNALHIAAQSGSINCMQLLIGQFHLDVNLCSTVDGSTALHLSAKEGQVQCLKYLIHCGTVVTKMDFNNRTALHLAVYGEHKDCILELLNSRKFKNGYLRDLSQREMSNSKTFKTVLTKLGYFEHES